MDGPSADGRPGRLFGDLGPPCGPLSRGTRGSDGPRRPPLPARNVDPGDDVGHAHRVARSAGRVADRPLASRRQPLGAVCPRSARPRGRGRPRACLPLSRRVRRHRDRLRARIRLRAQPGDVAAHRRGVRGRCLRGRGDRSLATPAFRSAPRVRGTASTCRVEDASRPARVLRPRLERVRTPARELRRGGGQARRDEDLLARLDRSRSLSGSPLAESTCNGPRSRSRG